MFLGIYTGTLRCIVKLPDEVSASHTKRVGENKSFYNSRSSQKCCSLVYPFKIILYMENDKVEVFWVIPWHLEEKN